MKLLVCVKQVPDTTEIKIDPVKGTLVRDGVPSILNPDDANALEEALRIKDNDPDTRITVVSMGPPAAEMVLYECLGMGADEAYLITDRSFGGSDTWATSNIIATAIKYIGEFDIIFAGRQAIDGDTAQVGPQIAEKLGLPQVTYVQKLEIDGNRLIIQRATETGYEVLEAHTPILLTCIKELNTPRLMDMKSIVKAFDEKEIKYLSNAELKIPEDQIGLKASPTNVKKTFAPEVIVKGTRIEGNAKAAAKELIRQLRLNHVI
jgi:electron transfer flavoprotein alpha/beta subunit